MTDLEKLSAIELGAKVIGREVRATEVIDYFASRIDEQNPKLNAFTYTKFDEALEEAKKIDRKLDNREYVGPLAGVPVALKDFLPAKKGWTASHGGVKSFITTDAADCTFWQAAKSLGCIAVGKTNAPSFGFRGTTYNKMYGNTRNPFNLDYNAGGSSGGSCSAVGGQIITLASTGDCGGSTRIPSAWCNVFGYKPSAGLVPSICRPDAWTATHPYCCDGLAARTVADSALIIQNMMRYDPKDPISVPVSSKNLLQLSECASVRGMKIGITYDYDLFPAVDPQVISAVDKAAKALQDAGAIVEYVHFNFHYTLEEMTKMWLQGASIDTAADMMQDDFKLIREHPEDLPDQFIYWTLATARVGLADYRRFHDIRTDILDAHLEVFKDYDIILSPVTSCMPVENEIDTTGPDSILNNNCEPLIGFSQTWLQNMTGNPAASIPAGLGEDNLPIGVHVTGKRYFDEDVYAVAYVLEQIMPWKDHYNKAVTV